MQSLEHIRDEWSACRPWLLPALEDDNEDSVLADLLANRAQIWRGDSGAMITQLNLVESDVGPPEPTVVVWLAGGDLEGVLALQPGVEAWGRWHGAKAVRINGRKGWARQLKRSGFEPDGQELRKEL